MGYYASVNQDRNKSNTIGNQDERLNLNFQNTFKVLKNLELTGAIWYTKEKSTHNGYTLTDLSVSGVGLSPYTKLASATGEALPILRNYRTAYTDQAQTNGLLNWDFKPLDEIKVNDNQSTTTEIRLNTGLKYSFFNDFSVNATYQYVQNSGRNNNYFAPEGFYVRNLVNEFTQDDGTQVIPYGGILDGQNTPDLNSHAGRVQLNYNKSIGTAHDFTALAGAEIRQQTLKANPGTRIYNYNQDVLTGNTIFDYTTTYQKRPFNYGQIPSGAGDLFWKTDRYLSYFMNAAYTYLGKYTLSGSNRWDGSNLFGVKTNQKGVPLYSIGASWELSKEQFYKLETLSYLRLRATYGSAGNINKSVSAYPTAIYYTDAQSNLPAAGITSPGNPDLRWEKVKTTNLGLDFATSSQRIQGSLEYYLKQASDLIGLDYMDPTTGIISNVNPPLTNKINYANLKTKGIDLTLNTQNLKGKFSWQSGILFSYVANKVTNFNTDKSIDRNTYFSSSAPPRNGQSRDQVYALPWFGLDHLNGKPLVKNGNELNQDYETFLKGFTKDNLPVAGLSSPPYFGSVMNTFKWKAIQLSALITWITGYVFRRTSISPGTEYLGTSYYHGDYLYRWKQPGDETNTNVPATGDYDEKLNQVYNYSEALLTKGDQIRLQDINLSYTLSKVNVRRLPFQSLRIYAYARNLGILWRANKQGLDPDYPNDDYPAPKTFALGLQLSL